MQQNNNSYNTYPQYDYNNINNPNQTPIITVDNGNTAFAILSFFIPIAGLIIYISEKDKKPKTAKQAGKCAIWGVVTNVIISILVTVITLCFSFGIMGIVFSTVDEYSNNDTSIIEQFEYNKNPIDISGKSFYDTDQSYITFEKDGSFSWYKEKNVQNDNYYKGTYAVYYGADAEKYLQSLTFSESELAYDFSNLNKIYGNVDYQTKDNLIVFILDHTEIVADGENQLDNAITTTKYFGFVMNDKIHLDMAHMSTGTYHTFELAED